MTLGRGVKEAISVFFVSLGEKNLNLLRCEIQYYDIMMCLGPKDMCLWPRQNLAVPLRNS